VSIGVPFEFKDFPDGELSLLELLGHWGLWRISFLTRVSIGWPLTQHSELGLLA